MRFLKQVSGWVAGGWSLVQKILVFLLDAQFLLSMVLEHNNSLASMYHKATKTIEHFNLDSQQLVEPSSNNGYKFELFVHSFLPHVQQGKLGVF